MKGVDSISDLNRSGTDMILGLEPGTFLMERIASDVIPRYHLSANLVEGSTPAMLAELEWSYGMQEPIVFLAWRPHFHTVAGEGIADHEPAAYALMNHMRLDADQVAKLEISINNAANPEAGVRDWLKERKNRELVRPWVEAGKRAQEEA